MQRFRTCAMCLCLALIVIGCTPRSADSLERELDSRIAEAFAQGNSPTLQVAVIDQGEIIWSQALGDDVDANTVYMNGSTQKMFTAAGVLHLAEQGSINLDADVNTYLPFPVRHPGYPDTPITTRLLLAHRSGLDYLPYQFEWDTGNVFAPEYRAPCPDTIVSLSPEAFMAESFPPEGINHDPAAWIKQPDTAYHYSVSAYPLLRYLVSQVSGQSFPAYMQAHIFEPLDMTHSGFSADAFAQDHATPHTRIDGQNIELPVWNGQGWVMHTTAEDMAHFLLMLMQDGRYDDTQVLQADTILLMEEPVSRFRMLFRGSDDLRRASHGLGFYRFRGGWWGHGGSVPGFQTLARYHPASQSGYVIISNVNAILGGGDNYDSARRDIYLVQDALIKILDPWYPIRTRLAEVGIVLAFMAWVRIFIALTRRKKQASQRSA